MESNKSKKTKDNKEKEILVDSIMLDMIGNLTEEEIDAMLAALRDIEEEGDVL